MVAGAKIITESDSGGAPEGKTAAEHQREKQEREWKSRVENNREKWTNADRLAKAKLFKDKGNDKFRSGNLEEAIQYFREAYEYVHDLASEKTERKELSTGLQCNLALAYQRSEDLEKCLESCTKALNHDADCLKALYRRGSVRLEIKDYEGAVVDLKKAVKLDAGEEVEELLREAEGKAKEHRKTENSMKGFLNRGSKSTNVADRTTEVTDSVSKDGKGLSKNDINDIIKMHNDETENNRAREEAEREAARIEKEKQKKYEKEEKHRMQKAFAKLSTSKEMLYQDVEEKMGENRAEAEKQRLKDQLECDLFNIVESGQGKEGCKNLSEHEKRRMKQAMEQEDDLEAKKRILAKMDREKKWREDDSWKAQDERNRAMPRSKDAPPGFEEKNILREVQHALRTKLTELRSVEALPKDLTRSRRLAGLLEDMDVEVCGMVVDVPKIDGEAYIWNHPHRQPIHFVELFVKMEWEIALGPVAAPRYRCAKEQMYYFS